MMISLAPEAMSSRKASGKAMSQHMRRPMGPRGVENVTWGCEEEEVRWGRSGCLWKGEGGTSQAAPCERGGGMGAAIHGGLEGGRG